MTEIVYLDLDAEWVVLSACNTATASAAGAEAFSGLARAFFQAGARSLLVSHWPVMSAPTRDLMVAILRTLPRGRDRPRRGPSPRQARPDRTGSGAPSIDAIAYADPMVWASFEMLGDPD